MTRIMAAGVRSFFQTNFILIILIIRQVYVVETEKGKTRSLYSPSDPLDQFNNDTIINVLSGNNRLYIVEFYSSWCGHCQVFAPVWKRLAYELKNWKKYVGIGAIDCAEERNLDTCKEFVIEMYPTIKFFNADWRKPSGDSDGKKEQMGIIYEGDKTIKLMRRAIIDRLGKEENVRFTKPNFEVISPERLQEVSEEFSRSRRRTFQYLALVFEEQESYTGKILMLDASSSNCKTVEVRRVLHSDLELTKKYNVIAYPSVILVTLGTGNFKELSPESRTHVGFVKALNEICDFMQEPPKVTKSEEVEIKEKTDLKASEVHMKDLAGAISFSLRREVPKKETIEGPALGALKDWVNVLATCFPAEVHLTTYLKDLDTWLNEQPNAKLNSNTYVDYLTNPKGSSHLPSIEWEGCQGSSPEKRGFPCSLWVLFHTLTVNCGEKSQMPAVTLMKRIVGFIDHFFGCRYCRNHFMKMAESIESEVSTYDDAILWLWKSHNKVNARLKESPTSDPAYPKMQFPPESMCSECRDTVEGENTIFTNPGFNVKATYWNKKVTLEFLKEHYGPDNIRIGDKKSEAPEKDTVRRQFNYVFYSKSAPTGSLSLIGLTSLDMNLCMVLYIGVIGAVIALYVYFIRRRKSKNHKYNIYRD